MFYKKLGTFKTSEEAEKAIQNSRKVGKPPRSYKIKNIGVNKYRAKVKW